MNDLVDIKRVNELKAIASGSFSFELLVKEYEKSSTGLINQLKQAIINKDLKVARTVVHTLKGASLNLGVTTLAALCLDAETACDYEDMNRVKELQSQIIEKFSSSLKELKQL